MISVDENNHNKIVWKRGEAVTSYNIYREGTQIGHYDSIANIPYDSPNSWVDMSSNARIRSYQYKIAAVGGECGDESKLSDAHRTMHLTISVGQGENAWILRWNPYEGVDYETYNIYRASSNTPDELELIGTMPAGNISYSDFTAPAGYVYYMVEIVLTEGCDLSKSVSSIKSNIASNDPNVGIVETRHATSLQVSPNPTTGQLHMTNVTGNQRAESGIYDIAGRKQKAESAKAEGRKQQADGEIVIDISHLPAGVYFMRVGMETVKVVKQ
jgi:fibronectin type 3 domain-containing protein